MYPLKHTKQVIGSLLFYVRAVDHTIPMTLNDITASQTKATKETERHMTKLLNYVATYPDATITFKAKRMKLIIHSDASYLSAPNSRSRAGGYFISAINRI